LQRLVGERAPDDLKTQPVGVQYRPERYALVSPAPGSVPGRESARRLLAGKITDEASQIFPNVAPQVLDIDGKVRLVGLPQHGHKLLGESIELVDQFGGEPGHHGVACRPCAGTAHDMNSTGRQDSTRSHACWACTRPPGAQRGLAISVTANSAAEAASCAYSPCCPPAAQVAAGDDIA